MNQGVRKIATMRAAILLPVLAGLLASGCRTTDPVTGRKTRNIFSIEDDIKMGESMLADVRAWAEREQIPVNRDADRVAQLERIMRDIAAVSHLPHLPYEVVLLHDGTVNAMAMPGGKLVVFEGLYHEQHGLVLNENELAFVMAHEIAHVNCRHSTEALTRDLPVQLLLLGGMLYSEYKDKDDLQLVFGGAFLFYNGLVVTKHSRKDEHEADRVGMTYMAHAGYDPSAAVQLWRRASEDESSFDRSLSFLATHPPSRDRARHLEKRLPDAMLAYEQSQRTGVQVASRPAVSAPPASAPAALPPSRDVPAVRAVHPMAPPPSANPPTRRPPAPALPAASAATALTPPARPAPAAAPTRPVPMRLELRTPSVRPGEKIVVVHSDFPIADRNAWIGFYDSFAARDQDYLSYTFLANLNHRTYDVIAPRRPGREYHFRIFPTEGFDGGVRSGAVEVQ